MNDIKQYDIVHIRDYYPTIDTPTSSPWVYDIVYNLIKNNIKSLIISPTPLYPKFVLKNSYGYRSSYSSKKIEQYLGTDVIRPLFFKIPKNIIPQITYYSLSRSIVNTLDDNINPKIIHAHFGHNGYASIKLKQKLNIPLITSFYGYDVGIMSEILKSQYRKLAKLGDLFLSLSQDMKNDLVERGFPEKKIIVNHLGIDLSLFKSNKIVKDKSKIFTFLVVARFNEKKGIQDVIRAFSKIDNKNIMLKIVGDGIFKPNLIKLTNELKISHKVQFINNFLSKDPRGVVLKEMQACDVFLLTSFTTKENHKEGTPVVLMEAQACGMPCISTFHAGIPEIVLNEKTGFLVKERDVESIAGYMELLYNNKTIVKQMGDNARKNILGNFNQITQIQKLISIYKKIMKHD